MGEIAYILPILLALLMITGIYYMITGIYHAVLHLVHVSKEEKVE